MGANDVCLPTLFKISFCVPLKFFRTSFQRFSSQVGCSELTLSSHGKVRSDVGSAGGEGRVLYPPPVCNLHLWSFSTTAASLLVISR